MGLLSVQTHVNFELFHKNLVLSSDQQKTWFVEFWEFPYTLTILYNHETSKVKKLPNVDIEHTSLYPRTLS